MRDTKRIRAHREIRAISYETLVGCSADDTAADKMRLSFSSLKFELKKCKLWILSNRRHSMFPYSRRNSSNNKTKFSLSIAAFPSRRAGYSQSMSMPSNL